LLMVLIGDWIFKSMVRLGLRGHHPHPPAPSPASGRGGEMCLRASMRSVCVRCLCAWVCADTTLTPRPPLPPAGEGERCACVHAGDLRYFHLVTKREV
jgi:hypothetical protein